MNNSNNLNKTKLLNLPGVAVDQIDLDDHGYEVKCHPTIKWARCPACHHKSRVVRSHYTRKIQDLPIADHTVWLNLRLRQFKCQNPQCSRHFFNESLAGIKHHARRTNRLDQQVLAADVQRSSTASAALLRRSGIQIHKSAICNILKKNDHRKLSSPTARRH